MFINYCVPELKRNYSILNEKQFDLEIDADRRVERLPEAVVTKSLHKACLADARVADEHNFEHAIRRRIQRHIHQPGVI